MMSRLRFPATIVERFRLRTARWSPTGLRKAFDAFDDFWNGRSERLKGMQKSRLMDTFRGERDALVKDAEKRGISQEGAAQLSTIRSLMRWVDCPAAPPGPDAVPYLEKLLGEIDPDPDDLELEEREALLAAIHDLGGDAEVAALIWGSGPEPELLARYGAAVQRSMRRAGLTVAELAERSGLEPSEVVEFVYGTREARAEDTLRLASALGVTPDVFLRAMDDEVPPEPLSRDIGLNHDHPTDGDEVAG
jgi:hypothetical protein